MTRGEIQVFISSLHVIATELEKVDVQIPVKVYDELHAMEHVLKRELEDSSLKVFKTSSCVLK